MVEAVEMAAPNLMPQKGSDQLVFIGGGYSVCWGIYVTERVYVRDCLHWGV